MMITFENDNDVIVYAFEKVIAYARRTQQIFVAQCVWWLASIMGLEQGLVIYLDNIQSRLEVAVAAEELSEDTPCAEADRDIKINCNPRGVSTTPRDIQEDSRSRATLDNVHQDRRSQIQISDNDISNLDIEDSRLENIAKESEKFIDYSRKERKAVAVTAQIGTRILMDNGGRFLVVSEELCYGRTETWEDAEEAVRRWRYNLVR